MDKPKLVRALQQIQDQISGCVIVIGDITPATLKLSAVLKALDQVEDQLAHIIEEI